MYQDYYQLDADPFRLTADLRFLFPHKGYSEAYAGMRYALHEGDGILVITGTPGTGKTMLVESFCAQLQQENILHATLVSTHLPGDDVLSMVAYEFGLDPSHKAKAVVLHELKDLLSHRTCAVLIIDEAQNLPAVALEELRMLFNLKQGSRPLLHIILIGQESLHQQLHAPGMEQLHQRLSAVIRLQPLCLLDTRDYILHRLNCAGWRGNPALCTELIPVIHRFSQGFPRYICKFCSRLLLYGAMKQLQQLSMDDAVDVLAILEQEMLLPLHSEQEDGAAEPLPHLKDLIQSQGRPIAERLSLSAEEAALLKDNPVLINTPPGRGTVQDTTQSVAGSPVSPGLAKHWLDFRSWQIRIVRAAERVTGRRALGYVMVLLALLFGSYRFGLVTGQGSRPKSLIPSRPTVELPVTPDIAAPTAFPKSGSSPLPAMAAFPSLPLATTVSALISSLDPTLNAPWSLMNLQPPEVQAAVIPPMTVTAALLRAHEPLTQFPAGTYDPAHEEIAVVPPSTEEQITALLRLAELAIAIDHLRIPKSDNAWSYYLQVLALDPDNAAADEGLRRIAARYAQLAQWRITKQDYDKADVYIDRGLGVHDGNSRLLALRKEVAAHRLADSLAAAEAQVAAALPQEPAPEAKKAEPQGFFAALKRFFGGADEPGE